MKGILHSPQHTTRPLLCRKLQLPVQAEHSGELGRACVRASRGKDLSQHSRGTAALGVQMIDEGTLVEAMGQTQGDD